MSADRFCNAILATQPNFVREKYEFEFNYQQQQTIFENFDFTELLHSLDNLDLSIQNFNNRSESSYVLRFGDNEKFFEKEFLNRNSRWFIDKDIPALRDHYGLIESYLNNEIVYSGLDWAQTGHNMYGPFGAHTDITCVIGKGDKDLHELDLTELN